MRISDWSSDVCSSDLLVRRHAVYLVIGRHDGGDAGALHHFPEGRKEIFAQFPFGDRRGCDILAALGLAMAGHVLERRHDLVRADLPRSEEHTSELQSLMRISYAVFCLNRTITNN